MALGGLLLDLPEAREVVEQRLGPRDVGVDRRADPLDLLLQRLAADHVLVFAELAHDVEVLEALELAVQVAAARLVVVLVPGRRQDRFEDERAQLGVGMEVAQPVDELLLQRLGRDDALRAVVAAAARAALVDRGAGTVTGVRRRDGGRPQRS
ncbi:MAG TPA: hypothetical protein VFS59_09230 [Gemmatimonadaceae bacterium]|nr:hypothetical protein [Gemmatimonadaceae bacterium]